MDTALTDPRLNLPSASSLGADAACPGRRNLLRTMSDTERRQELPDALRDRGTKIHKAWQTGDTSDLLEDELEDYNRAVKLSSEVDAQWGLQADVRGDCKEVREQRLWLRDAQLNPLMSGQFDRLLLTRGSANLQDLKSGFCSNLSPAEKSWQLRALAVMVWREYGDEFAIDEIWCSFITPKRRPEPPVLYTVLDLERAEAQIRSVLWASSQPDAPRSAGQHCQYCPAKSLCPEAAAYSLLPSVVARAAMGNKKADVVEAVSRLAPADWKFIWQRASIIRNILDAASASLKSLPADQLKELGLTVEEGRRLDPIKDIAGAYDALLPELGDSAIWSCMELSKTKLAEVAATAKGMTKKDAAAWVKQKLAPYIEEKRASGSLEEV